MPAKRISTKTNSSGRSKKVKFQKRISVARPLLFAAVFSLIGIAVLITTLAQPKEAKLEKFINNPGRGWVWDGLREPVSDDSLCRSKDKDKTKDLLELVDPKTDKAIACTHGPDPGPEGFDVRKRTEPLRTGEYDATALAPGGGGGGEPATVPASTITCDGDGVSGNRVQVIYARASDQPDGYSKYKASIQGWAAAANNIFVESGLQTGSARSVRFVHDANCFVAVDNVVLPPNGDNSLTDTVLALQQIPGYDRGDRKYMIWMDANIICGQSTFRVDSQPGTGNMNNWGSMWARIDNGCWNPTIYESPGYAYAAHEIMHMMGGVQSDAPHRSYQSHCTDEYDLMCYDDDESVPLTYPRLVMTYACPIAQINLLDCNDDDYYHTGTPPADSYLATHWNTANNIFLFKGGTTTLSTAGDTTEPVVTISSPVEGAKVGAKTSIKASATDNVGVIRYEIWIDGILKANTKTYSWTSRDASPGLHTITVKAYDAAGNWGQKTHTVNK